MNPQTVKDPKFSDINEKISITGAPSYESAAKVFGVSFTEGSERSKTSHGPGYTLQDLLKSKNMTPEELAELYNITEEDEDQSLSHNTTEEKNILTTPEEDNPKNKDEEEGDNAENNVTTRENQGFPNGKKRRKTESKTDQLPYQDPMSDTSPQNTKSSTGGSSTGYQTPIGSSDQEDAGDSGSASDSTEKVPNPLEQSINSEDQENVDNNSSTPEPREPDTITNNPTEILSKTENQEDLEKLLLLTENKGFASDGSFLQKPFSSLPSDSTIQSNVSSNQGQIFNLGGNNQFSPPPIHLENNSYTWINPNATGNRGRRVNSRNSLYDRDGRYVCHKKTKVISSHRGGRGKRHRQARGRHQGNQPVYYEEAPAIEYIQPTGYVGPPVYIPPKELKREDVIKGAEVSDEKSQECPEQELFSGLEITTQSKTSFQLISDGNIINCSPNSLAHLMDNHSHLIPKITEEQVQTLLCRVKTEMSSCDEYQIKKVESLISMRDQDYGYWIGYIDGTRDCQNHKIADDRDKAVVDIHQTLNDSKNLLKFLKTSFQTLIESSKDFKQQMEKSSKIISKLQCNLESSDAAKSYPSRSTSRNSTSQGESDSGKDVIDHKLVGHYSQTNEGRKSLSKIRPGIFPLPSVVSTQETQEKKEVDVLGSNEKAPQKSNTATTHIPPSTKPTSPKPVAGQSSTNEDTTPKPKFTQESSKEKKKKNDSNNHETLKKEKKGETGQLPTTQDNKPGKEDTSLLKTLPKTDKENKEISLQQSKKLPEFTQNLKDRLQILIDVGKRSEGKDLARKSKEFGISKSQIQYAKQALGEKEWNMYRGCIMVSDYEAQYVLNFLSAFGNKSTFAKTMLKNHPGVTSLCKIETK